MVFQVFQKFPPQDKGTAPRPRESRPLPYDLERLITSTNHQGTNAAEGLMENPDTGMSPTVPK